MKKSIFDMDHNELVKTKEFLQNVLETYNKDLPRILVNSAWPTEESKKQLREKWLREHSYAYDEILKVIDVIDFALKTETLLSKLEKIVSTNG